MSPQLHPDNIFKMFILQGPVKKHFGEGYFDMNFDKFVDMFDIPDNAVLLWSSSLKALRNGFGAQIITEADYDKIITQLRSQRSPRRVYFTVTNLLIPWVLFGSSF